MTLSRDDWNGSFQQTSTARGSRVSIRSCSLLYFWILKVFVVSLAYQSCRQSYARVSSSKSTCQLPQEMAQASGRSRERSCCCSSCGLAINCVRHVTIIPMFRYRKLFSCEPENK